MFDLGPDDGRPRLRRPEYTCRDRCWPCTAAVAVLTDRGLDRERAAADVRRGVPGLWRRRDRDDADGLLWRPVTTRDTPVPVLARVSRETVVVTL